MTDARPACYEGTEPFPGGGPPPRTFEGGVRVAVGAAIVLVPFGGLAVAVWLAWGHGLNLTDVLLAAAFYLVTGLGVTIGFHRLFTHRSFEARRPLKIVLAVLGSMSFQGSIIGWVADHLGPRWALGVGAAAGFAAAIVAMGVLSRSGGEAEHDGHHSQESEFNLPSQR